MFQNARMKLLGSRASIRATFVTDVGSHTTRVVLHLNPGLYGASWVVLQTHRRFSLSHRLCGDERPILQTLHPIQEERTPNYDANNFLPVKIGQVFNDRFQVVAKLGYGTGSTVWLVKDVRRWKWLGLRFYTLKVLTREYSNVEECSELRASTLLNKTNSGHDGFSYVRTVYDSFTTDGRSGSHLCLLYEPMRETLTTFVTRLKDERVPIDLLKVTVSFLLKGLAYMHEECQIIHTDLQPDNILVGIENKNVLMELEQNERDEPTPAKRIDEERLVYLSRNFGQWQGVPGAPKISDFGLAMFSAGPHYHPIQPFLFQAPEVVLRAGWSSSADVWNLGVMLWDLLEGKTLFNARDPITGEHREDLRLQETIAFLGRPPAKLLARGKATEEYFSSEGTLKTSVVSPRSKLSLEDTVTVLDGEEKALFLNFVRSMLVWLPEDRATAKQLLSDPWILSIDDA